MLACKVDSMGLKLKIKTRSNYKFLIILIIIIIFIMKISRKETIVEIYFIIFKLEKYLCFLFAKFKKIKYIIISLKNDEREIIG